MSMLKLKTRGKVECSSLEGETVIEREQKLAMEKGSVSEESREERRKNCEPEGERQERNTGDRLESFFD